MIMISICYESVKRCFLSVCLYTDYPVSFATGSDLVSRLQQMICLPLHYLWYKVSAVNPQCSKPCCSGLCVDTDER